MGVQTQVRYSGVVVECSNDQPSVTETWLISIAEGDRHFSLNMKVFAADLVRLLHHEFFLCGLEGKISSPALTARGLRKSLYLSPKSASAFFDR